MTRKARKPKDFSRHLPTREPRACVLIVCEGEKTEPNYFNALRIKLRLSTVEVEVVGKEVGSAATSVVGGAKERRARRKRQAKRSPSLVAYDSVWCVMDVEVPQQETLDDALVTARDNGLKVILSNPCFEYWYLLHYTKTGRMMTQSEAGEALKAEYPLYKKGNPASFREFEPRTDQGIGNAKAVLRESRCDEDLRNFNSSTHVHRLVEYLRSIPDS